MSSAASPAPQSPPASPPSHQPYKIRAFCPVGLSYFERLLSLNRHSEIATFGLILVSTLGEPGHPTFAEISDEEFGKGTNVSREQYLEAIDTLEKFGYIRSRKNQRGRLEYSVAEVFRSESKGERVHCRCPQCQKIVQVDQRFIPIPHVVLRKLAACLEPAVYACFMVILRHTLKYAKERGVYATPEQLEISDFERVTGYDARSIKAALKKLCDPHGLALVQRKLQAGKASIYCPALENLYQLDRRQARVVVMPLRDKREAVAKPKPAETVEIARQPIGGGENESELKPLGYCKDCDAYFASDPVSEEEFEREQAKSPPRAGPGRAQKAKPSKWDETKRSIWEMYVAN